jgi:hypothetical protein
MYAQIILLVNTQEMRPHETQAKLDKTVKVDLEKNMINVFQLDSVTKFSRLIAVNFGLFKC